MGRIHPQHHRVRRCHITSRQHSFPIGAPSTRGFFPERFVNAGHAHAQPRPRAMARVEKPSSEQPLALLNARVRTRPEAVSHLARSIGLWGRTAVVSCALLQRPGRADEVAVRCGAALGARLNGSYPADQKADHLVRSFETWSACALLVFLGQRFCVLGLCIVQWSQSGPPPEISIPRRGSRLAQELFKIQLLLGA